MERNLFIKYSADDKTFESFQEEHFGDSAASGRETHAPGREHRTEVTEATEGDWGLRGAGRAFCGRRRLWAGNTRIGESIARRSQRGFWGLRGRVGRFVDGAAFGRETRASGKASHRGHRGHRGGILGTAGGGLGFCGRPGAVGGKHTHRRASHGGQRGDSPQPPSIIDTASSKIRIYNCR